MIPMIQTWLHSRVESVRLQSTPHAWKKLLLSIKRPKEIEIMVSTISLPFMGSLLFLLLTFGCSSENTLSGSLDQFYYLQHNLVRVRLYRSKLSEGFSYSELSIEYVASSTGAVPVRITLRIGKKKNEIEEVKPGSSYSIDKYGDITGSLPDGTEIPRFRKGTITFNEFSPELDAKVYGSFEANFPTSRDTLSLSGNFEAELELVTDPGPPRL